eukprot:CAMPEP_0170762624 /NCGR_PEP_ID=MMETSP0733-20121128/2875_1 /TAXON_ID=186038 /ORGANISM="Fragilariopsis kerguelensis, Strain L26-C5" /LENGTH=140 /DNA_ID=CAMNT_0011102829 /DNA_START=406 /DNA_END=828 /DNA_ORIENTATION=+
MPWTTVLAHIFPEFKNKQYLSYLNRSYQQGTGDKITLPYKNPATSNKRKSNEITPTEQDKAAAATYKSTNDSNVGRQFFVDPVMMNCFNLHPVTGTHNKHICQDEAGSEHRGLNVNNIAGNSKRNTDDTHRLLAPERQEK